jgi:formylglycine-generating enzyme required for sulfatase activity
MASNTITTAQLNEQILKYLKPEITHTPQAPGLIFGGQTVTLLSRAQGKYLSYQWYKNGQPIAGATGDRYVIENIDKTLHDGNYSLMVSNDFGTVTTQAVSLNVDYTFTVSSAGIEMIWCPPGTFMMGSPTSEAGRGADETQHQVTLTNGFYLGKYEITQAQYETLMTGNPNGPNAKPSFFKGNNRPVEFISWHATQVFLNQLNDLEQAVGRLPEGWKYALPTEAQWEYACRAGTNTPYSEGNDLSNAQANFSGSGGNTKNVGQYSPNLWGFFDMHGNVWEWVNDWKADYPGGSQSDPEGPLNGSSRVFRGGALHQGKSHLRSANRDSKKPNHYMSVGGFRIALRKLQPDTANPEIQLTGRDTISHSQGIPFKDLGAEAYDVRDGNITSQLAVTGSVDVNSTGTYLLTYTVQDGAGNTASTTRTVTVVGNRSVDLNATVAMDMIWCPPGTFTMGSPTTEAGRGSNETEHNVSLSRGFYLGKYEVTQAQYEAVTGTNPSQFNATGNGNRPVEKVNWTEAVAFCTQLTTQEQAAGRLPAGWAYVLPTESQWEYACRAGTTTAYSWGATIASSNANYNWDGGANDGNDFKQTRDVGQFSANPWGFFDMHGNVWEWTADRFWATYPTGNPVVDPTRPASGTGRVTRGGSWVSDGTGLRSARRHYYQPGARYNPLGFRVGFQKSQ